MTDDKVTVESISSAFSGFSSAELILLYISGTGTEQGLLLENNEYFTPDLLSDLQSNFEGILVIVVDMEYANKFAVISSNFPTSKGRVFIASTEMKMRVLRLKE